MKTQCPSCNANFKVADEHNGKKAKCPKCSKPFIIAEYEDHPKVKSRIPVDPQINTSPDEGTESVPNDIPTNPQVKADLDEKTDTISQSTSVESKNTPDIETVSQLKAKSKKPRNNQRLLCRKAL